MSVSLHKSLFQCFVAFLLASGASVAGAFGFDDVAALAQFKSRLPFQDGVDDFPADLKALTYDRYREIEFRADRALWRRERLPFEVHFFHPGGLHPTSV